MSCIITYHDLLLFYAKYKKNIINIEKNIMPVIEFWMGKIKEMRLILNYFDKKNSKFKLKFKPNNNN